MRPAEQSHYCPSRAKKFTRLTELTSAHIVGLITREYFISGAQSEKARVLPLRQFLAMNYDQRSGRIVI